MGPMVAELGQPHGAGERRELLGQLGREQLSGCRVSHVMHPAWTLLQFGMRIHRMRVLSGTVVYACGDRVYRWTP